MEDISELHEIYGSDMGELSERVPRYKSLSETYERTWTTVVKLISTFPKEKLS